MKDCNDCKHIHNPPNIYPCFGCINKNTLPNWERNYEQLINRSESMKCEIDKDSIIKDLQQEIKRLNKVIDKILKI